MAESGTIDVVIPQRNQNRAVTRQLTVDEALQFTPVTTSVLPAHGMFSTSSPSPLLTLHLDRIPIPQLSQPYHFRLTTHAERQSVYRDEFCNSKVKERLAVLLDPSRLSEMYGRSYFLYKTQSNRQQKIQAISNQK